MKSSNLKKIDFCLKTKSRLKDLVKLLENPHFKLIEPGFDKKIFDKYLSMFRFDKNLENLFLNHVLFEYLNSHQKNNYSFFDSYFKDNFSFNFKFLNKNLFLPCIFVNEDQNEIIHFFVSEIKSNKKVLFGNYLKNNSCNDFKNSVINSFNLLNTEKSFFIEALKFNSDLRGKSTSLSIYLAFFCLENQIEYNSKIICSGVLDSNGEICDTKYLNKKIQAVINENYNFFIVPQINYYNNPNLSKDLKVLPASDIKEAEKIFLLASQKGFSKNYMNFISFPCEAVSNNLNSVPANILKAFLKKTDEKQIVKKIVFSEPLFSNFIKNFIKTSNTDTEKAIEIISVFERHDDILLKSPFCDLVFLFFSIAGLTLSKKGIPSQNNNWIAKAESYIDKARKTKKGRTAIIWFSNHCLINSHHDKYIFNPEIPIVIKNTLKKLEKNFREECEFITGAADDTTGALCGTIAQNYGFCGKKYINQTKEYALKAIKYFGGEINLYNSKYSEDIKRQYNYLCFAYLDAKNFDEAKKYFLKYSYSNDLKQAVNSNFDQWGHFLCAAFLARTKNMEYGKIYFEKYKKTYPSKINKYHPSQLWFYNMGLLAVLFKDFENAKNLFETSINICMDKTNGDSIRVMALLGVCELVLIENYSINFHATIEEVKNSALKLAYLHFQDLFSDKKTIEILKIIRENKEKYFPFSYR
ncbi:MAG: hypothetical protein H6680_05105 [Desulfobacteraceae bacterium]|nr:hypothetical protein [Desulfobacteraceae bacterium]